MLAWTRGTNKEEYRKTWKDFKDSWEDLMIMRMRTRRKKQVLRMTFILHLPLCFISASSCSNKVHKNDLWNGSQLWVEACQTGRRSIRRRGRSFQFLTNQKKGTAYVQLKGDKWCEGLPVVRDYRQQGATRNFQLSREVILGLEKR